MPSKLEFTQQAIEKLGRDTEWLTEHGLRFWWRNVRGDGLQLSITGYSIFRQAGFESFAFELQNSNLSSRALLVMDRKITQPWAFVRNRTGKPSLVLFGSADAMMLTLYGDFAAWIKSLDHK